MKKSSLFIMIGIFLATMVTAEGAYLFFMNRGAILNTDAAIAACHSSSSPTQCWSDVIDLIMEKKGIDVAFEEMAKLYDTDSRFAAACHSFTHKVGAATYNKFIRNQDFAISPKTAYCGYGFYHGFMEELIGRSRDFEQARKFCAYVGKKLAAVTPDAELQCFHGIGHGSVNDHDPRNRGNERALVASATALCKKVSNTILQLYRCASGVFNGLAIFYMNGDYGLALKQDDPLWLCHEQGPDDQEACYGNMNVALLWMTKGKFSPAAHFIERIDSDDMAARAIRYLAAAFSADRQNQMSYVSEIQECRALQSRLRGNCIQGFAFGMLEHGPPQTEYIRPIQFCNSHELTESEQNTCFDYLFSYLGIWYPQDKAETICQIATPLRTASCVEQVRRTIKDRSRG